MVTNHKLSDDKKAGTRTGFKYGWLVFLGLALQLLSVLVVDSVNFGFARVMMVAGYIVLFPPLLANVRRPGIVLVLVGAFLNFLAIAANGGSMPIAPEFVDIGPGSLVDSREFLPFSKDTVQLPDSTRLRFLSDIFSTPRWLGLTYSVGDVLIAGGLVVFSTAPLFRRLRQAGLNVLTR